jgi:hypothetical protein
MQRTVFFMPRQNRAVRCAGRCPAPRQGDTPWTPGPLSLLPYVPQRSSLSRVRFAAHQPRALDSSGPLPRLTHEKGKRANAKLFIPRLCTAFLWSAPSRTTSLE